MKRSWNPTAHEGRTRRQKVLAALGWLLYFAFLMAAMGIMILFVAATAPTLQP